MTAPHQDCPPCPDCTAPCGTTEDARAPGWLICAACGHEWEASRADLEQARRADAAYAAFLAGDQPEPVRDFYQGEQLDLLGDGP